LFERSQVRIPLGSYLCFFNLILARRGMYVGMGMRFCGEGGMRKTVRGGEGGMGMTEHGMVAYPLPS
jgi:hypothetical protein